MALGGTGLSFCCHVGDRDSAGSNRLDVQNKFRMGDFGRLVLSYPGAEFSFIPLDSPAYEHRMYLPLAAVVVLGVMGIHALIGRRTLAVAMALAIALGVLTAQRNEDYRNEIAIWSDTVAKRPENSRAHCDLGVALARAGRLQEAMGQYEQALRFQPDSAGGTTTSGTP